jgi:hypothetical protein
MNSLGSRAFHFIEYAGPNVTDYHICNGRATDYDQPPPIKNLSF